MIILGIDPGYAIVGYGVVEYNGVSCRPVSYGAVTTPAGLEFSRRLEVIYDGVAEVLKKYPPDAMAVEELYFTTNAKTAIGVAQARGVILLAAKKAGVEVYEYTPLQVKQAVVGYGKAVKKQVQELTKVLLHLKEIPKPDDTADALAIAVCHANSSGSALGALYRKLKTSG